MRPLLNPALSRAWRDSTTLQFGVTPEHAVVLGGVRAADLAVINELDGRHGRADLRAIAVAAGGEAVLADRLVDTLVGTGAAVDAATAGPVTTAGDVSAAARAPDAASLGVLGVPGGPAAAMARRAAARVDVVGAGRVGACVARLLAAAGIGRVVVDDPGLTTPADLAPGGLGPRALGLPRDRAVADLLGTNTGDDDASGVPPLPRDHPADFVVLAPVSGHDRTDADDALRAGTPHLLVQLVETTAVVGPLVRPGHTSCVRCHDLRRTDGDPYWPLVAHQATARPAAVPAGDVSLAAAIAGLAAGQVLAHLDGFEAATENGTIEITLPGALPRRRSWRPHPSCGCTWAEQAVGGTMAL